MEPRIVQSPIHLGTLDTHMLVYIVVGLGASRSVLLVIYRSVLLGILDTPMHVLYRSMFRSV
jgi:hypothetical protein